MEKTKQKFPFGFYVCSLSFTFERLAYYSAKWGIAIFVALEVAKGGLGLDKATGALMNSNIVAFTYITPIIGGYIADRWIAQTVSAWFGQQLSSYQSVQVSSREMFPVSTDVSSR